MQIEAFQESFKNKEINLKSYIRVVTIFIIIIFVIVLFNNRLEDYYKVSASIHDKKIELLIDLSNLDKITTNNKIKIERNIFTYKTLNISNYIKDDNLIKKITIAIDNENADFLIDNNYIEAEIITGRLTIFEYLLKTIKGE